MARSCGASAADPASTEALPLATTMHEEHRGSRYARAAGTVSTIISDAKRVARCAALA
jgi:hypothetical protein